jgi:ribonuclease HI
MDLVAYIDGGSRGNPGPAGYGVRVEDTSGRVVAELREPLGTATNNVAEYRGLIAALSFAVERGALRLKIRSDSQLLVKQMRGEYRVKHHGLQLLHRRARSLMAHLESATFEHIPRTGNAEADRLANLAMDDAEQERNSGM